MKLKVFLTKTLILRARRIKSKMLFTGATLTALGTILTTIASLSIRSTSISIEAEFGLSNYLPSFFWVGFVLVMAGSVLVGWSGGNVYRILALLVIAFVMWGTPVLIEAYPRHSDVYWYMSATRLIVNSGQISLSQPRMVYLEYPSVFLLGAILTIIGVPSFSLMVFYPILITFVFTFGFYILSQKLLGNSRRSFFATMFSLACNIVMFANHFSPSATAEAFLPLVLYSIIKMCEPGNNQTYVLMFFPLITFYTLLHPAMPLLLLLLTFGLFLVKRSYKYKLTTFVIVAAWFFSWMVFVGSWGLTNLSLFTENLEYRLLHFGAETPGTQLISQLSFFPTLGLLKTAIFSGFVLCAFLAIGIRVLRHRKGKANEAIVFFLLTLPAYFFSSFATEVADRALFWVIPFSILVVASTWKPFRQVAQRRLLTALVLILVSVSTLTFLAYYSGERSLITTRAEYYGLSYTASTIHSTDIVLMDKAELLFYYTQYQINYSTLPLTVNQGTYAPLSLKWMPKSNVIIFQSSSYVWQYYEVSGNTSNSYTSAFKGAINDQRFDVVYSDSDVVMLRRNGK